MLIYFHRFLVVRLFTIIHGENIVRDIHENKDNVEIKKCTFFLAMDIVIFVLILSYQAGEV